MELKHRVYLVPFPPRPTGRHTTFAVAGELTAEWVARLITFAPAELLERAGPIPPHMEGGSLIAAAADLLAACKWAAVEMKAMHSHHHPTCEGGCPWEHAHDAARAAIAKAEGGE